MAEADKEDDDVYCLCRRPYQESEFMIECDVCKDWFHGRLGGAVIYWQLYSPGILIEAHQHNFSLFKPHLSLILKQIAPVWR